MKSTRWDKLKNWKMDRCTKCTKRKFFGKWYSGLTKKAGKSYPQSGNRKCNKIELYTKLFTLSTPKRNVLRNPVAQISERVFCEEMINFVFFGLFFQKGLTFEV
jgi:hypothetical protein